MKRRLFVLAAIVTAAMAMVGDSVAAAKKKDQSRLPPTNTLELQEPPAPPPAPKTKEQSRLPQTIITYDEAKKICAKKYGIFHRAVVRNGRVICYL